MILKVIEQNIDELTDVEKENYTVLGVPIDSIEVGTYKEDTKEYFDCLLYSKDRKCLAQFRYFDEITVPKHTVESEVQNA